MFAILLLCAFSISFAQQQINLTGFVKNENGAAIKDAAVFLKIDNDLVSYMHVLSDKDGVFAFTEGNIDISPIIKQPAKIISKNTKPFIMDMRGRSHSLNAELSQGVYITNFGLTFHKGGVLRLPEVEAKIAKKPDVVAASDNNVKVVVKKAGYLPASVNPENLVQNLGDITLKRDPLENRIDSVLALMTTADKIAQMNQTLCSAPMFGGGSVSCTFGNNTNLNGSVLQGGEGHSASILTNAYTEMLKTGYKVKIPITYGKDMMHGAAAISGATIFPHNIGMGATRDSSLVRKACEITAQESWAGNVDLIFGPAISVPQDERWGRVYEGFGETAELAAMMGAACVRGYQGNKYNAEWRVIATAKHYLGDGATDDGKDRGNSTATDSVLRALHLPGYEAVVEQGVLSIMASFNQIRGTHQHVDSLRLTGWLKTELAFDGYVIADWSGISNSMTPGYTDECNYGNCSNSEVPNIKEAIKKSINAGLDMAMNESSFVSNLTALVNEGSVSEARIDDAVRRILRAKFRAGRMDNPNPQGVRDLYASTTGSASNRAVAREAVRKSLVLLKNENNALPISKSAKVFVTGTHANSTANQCGGWTLGWQGATGNVAGATSIQAGIDAVAPNARVTQANEADIIIYVTGEEPYAEWHGDITNITFSDNTLSSLVSQNPGKKVVTVFISGRPRETNSLLNVSDAFVAAWLPGSEGAGVADVLFGDYDFVGKLPHTWPINKSVFPKNSAEPSNDWFYYGFGLTYND